MEFHVMRLPVVRNVDFQFDQIPHANPLLRNDAIGGMGAADWLMAVKAFAAVVSTMLRFGCDDRHWHWRNCSRLRRQSIRAKPFRENRAYRHSPRMGNLALRARTPGRLRC